MNTVYYRFVGAGGWWLAAGDVRSVRCRVFVAMVTATSRPRRSRPVTSSDLYRCVRRATVRRLDRSDLSPAGQRCHSRRRHLGRWGNLSPAPSTTDHQQCNFAYITRWRRPSFHSHPALGRHGLAHSSSSQRQGGAPLRRLWTCGPITRTLQPETKHSLPASWIYQAASFRHVTTVFIYTHLLPRLR